MSFGRSARFGPACARRTGGGLAALPGRLAALGPRYGSKRRPARGFTLVEVVVASAVLAVALSGLLILQAASARTARLARERDALTDVASQALARWRAGHTAAAACELGAAPPLPGLRCGLEERSCELSEPVRCERDPGAGTVVEAIITVAASEGEPLVLRGLRRLRGGGP